MREFEYRRSGDQDRSGPAHHSVVVIGAGPVGLSVAIDLAGRGIDTVLLDDDHSLSTGSRAICFAQRTLEIFDRLGCGAKMVEKGVSWSVGRVYLRDELVYSFDLLAEGGHRRPAFINLQQYYVEEYLFERARECAALEVRWSNRLIGITQRSAGVEIEIDTPEGPYRLACDYLVCADGSKSTARRLLGLEARGHTFRDRFLIADVRMKAPFPAERWFWFDPPFHPKQSALLHRQPDDVWRIDFQLGWDADPVVERAPERVIPRVRAMLGPEVEFELEWVSVYTFSCTRMERFTYDRVFFAGDAAHGVSPFGARGANGGVQDAENLAWKLAWVLKGHAGAALLLSYDTERIAATDENILNSTRSTDFITPKSPVSRTFRDATLSLARHHEFARTLVNSGRLSRPAHYVDSALNTPDETGFAGPMVPGAPCVDAPLATTAGPGWLLEHLGRGFVLLVAADPTREDLLQGALDLLGRTEPDIEVLLVRPLGAGEQGESAGVRVVEDSAGLIGSRYDLNPGTAYLIRPDQHVCARWRMLFAPAVSKAHARARALEETM